MKPQLAGVSNLSNREEERVVNVPEAGPELGLTGSPDDVRDALRAAAAEPGGNRNPVVLTERQRNTLRAIVDEIIPPGEGFPAPSEVGVVDDFIPRYVTPRGARTAPFPAAREEEFCSGLDAVSAELQAADRDARIAVLCRLEADEPEFFGQLRALTYAGYYSRPAVVEVLRSTLDAARDYHGPPLPYGYDATTRDWDDLVPPADGRFIATLEVVRASAQAG